MKKLAVFCGSSSGKDTRILEMANRFGVLMGEKKISLIYGGASIGVMGAVANGVLSRQGSVHGVIPKKLEELEVSHRGLTKLEVAEDMHARKARMYDLADSFLALPGGFGTLDEIFEVLTWAQIGYHSKPCYILNYYGFYDYLLKHIQHLADSGFISPEHLRLLRVFDDGEELLQDLLKR